MPDLLFEFLPDSGTEYIVRLVASKSEQEEDWINRVPMDSVLALLKSGGGFPLHSLHKWQ